MAEVKTGLVIDLSGKDDDKKKKKTESKSRSTDKGGSSTKKQQSVSWTATETKKSTSKSGGSSSGGGSSSSAGKKQQTVTWKATPQTASQAAKAASGGKTVTGSVMNNVLPKRTAAGTSGFGAYSSPTFAAAQKAAQKPTAPLVPGVKLDVNKSGGQVSRPTLNRDRRTGFDTPQLPQRTNTPLVPGVKLDVNKEKSDPVNTDKRVVYGKTVDNMLPKGFNLNWDAELKNATAPMSSGKVVTGKTAEIAAPNSDLRKWYDRQLELAGVYDRSPSWSGSMYKTITPSIATMYANSRVQEGIEQHNAQVQANRAAMAQKYNLDLDTFDLKAFDEWGKKYGYKSRRDINEMSWTHNRDKSVEQDAHRLYVLARENQKRSGGGSVGAFGSAFADSLTFGFRNKIADVKDRKRYAENGDLVQGSMLSNTYAQQITNESHPWTSGAGNILGGFVQLAVLGSVGGEAVAMVPGFTSLPTGIQNVIVNAVAMGVQSGIVTVGHRDPNEDVGDTLKKSGINAAFGALGGAVGSAASHGMDTAVQKVLFDKGLQNRIIAQTARAAISSGAFAAGDAAGSYGKYLLLSPEDRPTARDVAQNIATAMAFGALQTGSSMFVKTRADRARLDSVVQNMQADYQGLVDKANRRYAETGELDASFREHVANVGEYARAIDQYLDGTGYYGTIAGEIVDLPPGAEFIGQQKEINTIRSGLRGVMERTSEFTGMSSERTGIGAGTAMARTQGGVIVPTGGIDLARANADYDITKGIAEKLGTTVRNAPTLYHPDGGTLEGMINTRTNEMSIAGDAPSRGETAAHESGHFIERWAPEQYARLERAAVEAARKANAAAVESREADKINDGYPSNEISAEVTNDVLGVLAQSRSAIDRLAANKPERVERIINVLQGIKARYHDYKGDTIKTAKGLEMSYSEVNRLLDMYSDALTAAREGYNAAVGTSNSRSVKYSVKSDINGDPYVEIDGDILKGVPESEWNKTVIAELKKFAGGIDYNGDQISLGGKSRRKFVYSKDSDNLEKDVRADKFRMAQNIDEIIQQQNNSAYEDPKHGRKDNIIGFERGTTQIKVGDHDFTGEVVIGITDTGEKLFYDIVNLEQTKIQSQSYTGRNEAVTAGRIEGSVFDTSIPQQSSSVNPQNKNNSDTLYSRRPVTETKNLVALHNINEDKLRSAFELGGLAMPSLAVTKADIGHEGFGSISLVFDKSTIDPEADIYNKVYGGDAYTPTFPKVVNKPDTTTLKALGKKLGLSTSYLEGNYFEDKTTDDAAVELGRHIKTQQAFITDRGYEVTPVPQEVKPEVFEHKRAASFLAAHSFDEMMGSNALIEEYLDSAYPPSSKSLMTRIKRRQSAEALDLCRKDPELYNAFKERYEKDRRILAGEVEPVINSQSWTEGRENLIKEHRAEYDEYVRGLVSSVMGDKYIRNDKGIYTDSGNRRSFDELHEPYDLDNVVAHMRMELQSGQGGFVTGAPEVRGAASRRFSSIADIKDNSSRITRLSEEDADSVRQEFSDRLYAIAMRAAEGRRTDPLRAASGFSEDVVDVLNKSGTKAEFERRMRSLSSYYNITPALIRDTEQLIEDMRSAPVKYFEAKPQRAVGFDEVRAAVVPDNASDEIVNELKSRGIDVRTYPAGNEQARTDIINSMDDVKFSRRAAGMPSPARSVANYFADYLDESQFPKDELYERMDEAYMLTGAAAREVVSGTERTAQDAALDYIHDIAADIVRSSYNTAPDSEQYNEAKQELRGRRIYVPEDVRQSGEIADAGYGYNRRRVFGQKLYLVNDPSNGAHVEDVYTDLHNRFPQYFPETDGAEGQLNNIIDFMQGQPNGGRTRMYSDKDIDSLASSIIDDLYDKVMDADPKMAQAAPKDAGGRPKKISKWYKNTYQKAKQRGIASEAFETEYPDAKYYEQRSMEQGHYDAQKAIEELGYEQTLNKLYKKNSDGQVWNADDTQEAYNLMDHYSAIGDFEREADIGLLLREQGTKQGQAVQIHRAVERMSPGGQWAVFTREHEKLIDKQVEEMGDIKRRKYKKHKKKAEELDRKGDMIERMKEEIDRIENGTPADVEPPQEPTAEGAYTDEPIPPMSQKANEPKNGTNAPKPRTTDWLRSAAGARRRKKGVSNPTSAKKKAAAQSLLDRINSALGVATDIKYSRRSVTNSQAQTEVLNRFGINRLNDYIHVQRQVIDTLKNEGFFSDHNGTGRTVVNDESGMVIDITPKGIKETFGSGNRFVTLPHDLKVSKLKAVDMIPDVLKNGTLKQDNVKNYHNPNSPVGYAYIEADITLDGEPAVMEITVRKSLEKNKFWMHKVEIKKIPGDFPNRASSRTGYLTSEDSLGGYPAGASSKTGFRTSEVDKSISRSGGNVNPQNDTDVKYSRSSNIPDTISGAVRTKLTRLLDIGDTEAADEVFSGIDTSRLSESDRQFMQGIVQRIQSGDYGSGLKTNLISEADRQELLDLLKQRDFEAAWDKLEGYDMDIISKDDEEFISRWSDMYDSIQSGIKGFTEEDFERAEQKRRENEQKAAEEKKPSPAPEEFGIESMFPVGGERESLTPEERKERLRGIYEEGERNGWNFNDGEAADPEADKQKRLDELKALLAENEAEYDRQLKEFFKEIGEENPKAAAELQKYYHKHDYEGAEDWERKNFVDEINKLYNVQAISVKEMKEAERLIRVINDVKDMDSLIRVMHRISGYRNTAWDNRVDRVGRAAIKKFTGKKIAPPVERSLRKEELTLLKETALKQVWGMLADKKPVSFWEKVKTLRIMGLLLNARTFNRNIGGNSSLGAVDALASYPATAADKVMGLFTGNRTVSVDKGVFTPGNIKASIATARRAKIGINLNVDMSSGAKYGIDGGARRTFKSGPLAPVERVLGYALNVTDAAAKGSKEHSSNYYLKRLKDKEIAKTEKDLLKRRENGEDFIKDLNDDQIHELAIFSNPVKFTDEEMAVLDQYQAEYATLQDNSYPAFVMTGMYNWMNKYLTPAYYWQLYEIKRGTRTEPPKIDFGTGDLVQPFHVVSGNQIARGLGFTPIGYFKMIGLICDAAKERVVRKQSFTPKMQRDIALAFGRACTGTGLIALGILLHRLGIIVTDYRDDTKLQKKLKRLEGIDGVKINLSAIKRGISGYGKGWNNVMDGDNLQGIDFAEPFNNILTYAANLDRAITPAIEDYREMRSNGEGAVKSIAKAAGRIGGTLAIETGKIIGAKAFDQVLDMSTMQFIRQISNAYKYDSPTAAVTTFAVGSLTSFIPTLSNHMANYSDTAARNSYNEESFMDKLANNIKYKIPGFRQTIPERVTLFGETRSNTTGNRVTDFASAFLSPGYITQVQSTDISDELYRMSTINEKAIPDTAPKSFDAGGNHYAVFGKEYEAWAKLYGRTAYHALKDVIESDYYKSLPDEDKGELLAKTTSSALRAAKDMWDDVKTGNIQTTVEEIRTGDIYSDVNRVSSNQTITIDGDEVTMKSQVTIDGEKYTLSPAMSDKYTKAVVQKTAEYQGYLTSGEKTVENVVGEYMTDYTYDDLTEEQRQKYIAEYDHDIAHARKAETKATHQKNKERFINGSLKKKIEVTGNLSDLPENIQERVLERAKTIAAGDVAKEMKDEIISGSTAPAEPQNVGSASRPSLFDGGEFSTSSTPRPSIAAARTEPTPKPEQTATRPSLANALQTTAAAADNDGSSMWSVRQSASNAPRPSLANALNRNTVIGRVVDLRQQPEQKPSLANASGGTRRTTGRSSSGGRKRSGGGGSGRSTVGTNTAATPSIAAARSVSAAQNSSYTPTIAAIPAERQAADVYKSRGYMPKIAARIATRYSSRYYSPIVLQMRRIEEILGSGFTIRDAAGNLREMTGYFRDLDEPTQQALLAELMNRAEQEDTEETAV